MTRLNHLAALAAAALLALAGCGGGGDSGAKSSGGPVEITMWHGQDDIAGKVLGKLADEFNRTHSDVKVKATTGGVVADQMRQKVTTALASGAYPDVAYIFGSDLANLARSDKVLDLTDDVKAPGFGWDDYYAPAKAATTVNGRVRALPALIDDLEVVYNKQVFKAAGVSEPPAGGWTWDQFTATAKQLTDRGKGTFGTAWPAVGDEDTVWRTWPLVWQAGGEVVDGDGKVGFGGAPGEQAFGVVDRLAQDGSVYVDTKPDSDQTYQLFNNDKIGMVVTGPWQLPDFIGAKTDFGVVPLPTFGGEPLTISAPDTWTIFDNGKARSKAAVEFIQWLNSPKQDARWVTQAGSLPLRKGTAEQPAWKAYQEKTPGMAVFVAGLTGARTKPTIPAYPQVSEAVGQSLVAVLLKRSSPQDALKQAVHASEGVLAGGG
ncbi:MAG: ABC transporter substrate-binding protein [Solirubrobacteraceae bacterium]